MVFIDAGGGFGLEAAEEMTLQIVVWQDQALGFVTDGKGNVLEPDVFLLRSESASELPCGASRQRKPRSR